MEQWRVLLAEDHSDVRRLLEITLERGGFDVIEARDGGDALERLKAVRPDVLVTDLDMPVLDGLQLVRAVRVTAGYERLPVLMLTGMPDDPRAEAVRAMPRTEVMVKPPRWSDLASSLNGLLAPGQLR